jgi:WD40 repeat protein
LIQIESRLWASGTGDGNIIFWNILDMDYPLFILEGHKFSAWCLLKLQKSTYIVSGSGDSTSRIWDYSSKKCKKVLINGTSTNVINLVSINKKIIAALSTDGCIRFWNLSEFKMVKKIVIFDSQMIVCCSYIINERLQLIGGSSKDIKLLDYKFKNKQSKYFLNTFINKSSVSSLTIITG